MDERNCVNCGKMTYTWEGPYCYLKGGFVTKEEVCPRWILREHEKKLLEFIRELNEKVKNKE